MSDSERNLSKSEWVEGDPDSRRQARESPPGIELKDPVPAHIVDISLSGFGLEAGSSLEPQTQHEFTIGVGEARAKVLGEIRWCKQVGSTMAPDGESVTVYRAGVALLEDIVLS
jgi:hypothetical protein